MRRRFRLRSRALFAALVLAGLGWLAATRRTPVAKARPHPTRRAPARRSPPRRAHARRGPSLPASSPWANRRACLEALKLGGAPRRGGSARVGAWNLHWFPDGRPGDARPGQGADFEWLACAVAWMRLDVLAVEEIKRPPRGTAGLDALRRELDRLSGGTWQSILDPCPRASSQHVGLLFDARRVRLVTSGVVGELNPLGEPCRSELRPGLAGYFAFPGGLDLSVVVAHLKSGNEERDFELRTRSFEAFAAAAEREREQTHDPDVLFIGDMNTLGCASCAPAVTAPAELTRVDALFASARAPLARLAAEPACSHDHAGEATLLDWAATSGLEELPHGARLTVSGACGELGCDALPRRLPGEQRLSDHCPIWLDLDDADRD